MPLLFNYRHRYDSWIAIINHSEVSMGGIKNKLSKLSNKVKNLLTNNQFLPLDRSSASGTASRSTPGQPEVRRSEGGRRPSVVLRTTAPFTKGSSRPPLGSKEADEIR